MRIFLTQHARERAADRGISMDEIHRAVLRGQRRQQGDHCIARYLYFEVVFEIVEDRAIVITVYALR